MPYASIGKEAIDRFRIASEKKSADLSVAALSYTTSIARIFRLESISIHFDAAVSPTVTITLVSKEGADYDTVLRKKALSSATDYFETFGEGYNFENGDEIKVEITSVAASAYVVIRFRLYAV